MGRIRATVVAVSTVRRLGRWHPWVRRVRALRVLPRRVAARLSSLVPAGSPARAALQHVGGDATAAAATLRTAVGTPRRVAGAVAVAAALHDPALLPADTPEPLTTAAGRRAQALLLRERGETSAARALVAADRARRSRTMTRMLDGELRTLTTIPALPAGSAPARPSGRQRGAVLHVVTNALPEVVAGYTTRTHGIASAQAARGLPTTVVTRLGFPATAGSLAAAPTIDIDGVHYVRHLPWTGVPSAPDDALAAEVVRVARLASDSGASVLHAHSHHINAAVALAAGRGVGIPVVYEVRGFLEQTWIARGGDPAAEHVRLSHDAETRVMCQADAVVTLSAGMREDIVARGVPPERVTIAPNSVDKSWLASPAECAGARVELGLPDGLLIGTVTSMNAYEGLDMIIEVTAALVADGIAAWAVLVGDGPARADLLREADRRGVRDRVIAPGRVEPGSARSYHRALDVFLVPRVPSELTAKVTPIKPIEAMASRSAVVLSDLPALREVCGGGAAGLLVAPGDTDAWIEAVRSLAGADRRSEMVDRAQAWVRRERTWTAVATQYDRLYTEVGAGRLS